MLHIVISHKLKDLALTPLFMADAAILGTFPTSAIVIRLGSGWKIWKSCGSPINRRYVDWLTCFSWYRMGKHWRECFSINRLIYIIYCTSYVSCILLVFIGDTNMERIIPKRIISVNMLHGFENLNLLLQKFDDSFFVSELAIFVFQLPFE